VSTAAVAATTVSMATDSREDDRTATSDDRDIVAVLDESHRGTVECLLFPADADREERETTWVSAEEGSFVPLDEMA
jgi:hypothetical protein